MLSFVLQAPPPELVGILIHIVEGKSFEGSLAFGWQSTDDQQLGALRMCGRYCEAGAMRSFGEDLPFT